jgi:hypothetical protein
VYAALPSLTPYSPAKYLVTMLSTYLPKVIQQQMIAAGFVLLLPRYHVHVQHTNTIPVSSYNNYTVLALE